MGFGVAEGERQYPMKVVNDFLMRWVERAPIVEIDPDRA
jgi:hypothetical protein